MSTLPPASQQIEGVGSGRTLFITLGVLMVAAALSIGAAWLLGFRSQHLDHAASVEQAPRPEAAVSGIHAELFRGSLSGERSRAAQRQKLERFGWVDQEHKLVHIPIDVAMDLEASAASAASAASQGAKP